MLAVFRVPARAKETDSGGNGHLLLSIRDGVRGWSRSRLKPALYSCAGGNVRPYKSVRKYNIKGINKNYYETTSFALYRLQHGITEGTGTYKGRCSR